VAQDPVPALIIAGFLGAGKTTLVRHLLEQAQREGLRLAIISNEFGDTGIDKALMEAGEDGLVELDGGCVCCRLSDALGQTVEAVMQRARPDRLVLECSGVALPGDVLVQFWREPIAGLVSDEVVVVVVDATAAVTADDETWIQQLEAADLVIMNKVDLVDDATCEAAMARVASITQGRPALRATSCAVDPRLLFPPDPERLARRDPDVAPRPHSHEHFATKELFFAGEVNAELALAAVHHEGALRAKGFIRTPEGLCVLQGVGDRIDISPFDRPVPEHLIGRVVVIHRAGGSHHHG
jgi:G3E family GTPase